MEHSVRILLVEGRRSVQKQFASQLSSFNTYLESVPGPATALERVQTIPFDLVTIGSEIEQGERLSLIRELQKLGGGPAILVLIPARGEALAAEALNRGAGDYIIHDKEDRYLGLLPMVVRNILRRRQLEKEKLAMLNTLQKRNLTLASLNQVSNELTSLLDLSRITNRLMRAAIEILNAEGGSLWLWNDSSHEEMVCGAVIHRTNTPPLLGLKRRRGEGVVGWVAERNRSAFLNQVDRDDRFSREIDLQINFTTDSLMAVPLRVRDEVTGVLEFVNKIDGPFDEDDLSLAETLAASAATALENARLVEELRLYTLDLEERNEELNAFGHTLAHDLQNMLSRIVGFAELLMMEIDEPADGELSPLTLYNAAELISRNSRKMSGIIEALLQLAAVRKMEVHFEPIEMGAVVEEAVVRLHDLIAESGATLCRPKEWPTAYGYSPWVEEVWFNYISNALKYGGRPPKIQLGADSRPETQEIRYWVADNGVGIDPINQQELFRPFKRISTSSEEGHGLGLSIVARIVKRMGGAVGVTANPEGGSCFYFTLPRYQSEPRASRVPAEQEA